MKRSITLVTAFVLTQLCLSTAYGQTPNAMSIRTQQIVLSDPAGHYLLINTPGTLTGNLVWTVPVPPAANLQSGFVGVGTASGQMLYWDNTAGAQQWKQSSNISWDNATHTLTTDNLVANTSITSGTLSLTSALTAPNGGTGIGSYTPGAMLYASTSSTLAQVAPNTTATPRFLSQSSSGAPVWSDPAGSFIQNNATATPQASASINVDGAITSGSAGQFAVSAMGAVTSTSLTTGAVTATELRGAGTSSGSASSDASYAGSIAVATPQTTYTITSSKVKPTSSIILTYVESSDAGHSPAGQLGAWVTNLANGSFNIQLSAAPPAPSVTGSRVCYMIVNP